MIAEYEPPDRTHTHKHTHILVKGFNWGYDTLLRATGHIQLFGFKEYIFYYMDELNN